MMVFLSLLNKHPEHAHERVNILRVHRTSLINCSGSENCRGKKIAISKAINSEFIFKVEVLLNLPPGTGPRKSAASCQEAYFKE